MNPDELMNNLLVKGTSQTNQNDVSEAVQKLKELENDNFPLFILTLTNHLSNPQKDPTTRILAGICLKNSLMSDNPEVREGLVQRWNTVVPDDFKVRIKEMLYHSLSDKLDSTRRGAALGIAKIFFCDFATPNPWFALIDMCVGNVTTSNDPFLRQSSLDVLGYICEEADPERIPQLNDKVLTAVCFAMRPEEEHLDVKEAAAKALNNAIDFCKKNFDNETEKKYLMNCILHASAHPQLKIKLVGLQLLIQVASLYYEKLTDYIVDIFKITIEYIIGNDEEISKLAIEFWASIADEEIEFTKNRPDFNKRFCSAALKDLVPVLLQSMTKQDNPDYDMEEFTLPMSASVCLNFIAQAVKQEIVPHIFPFFEHFIKSGEWNMTDAAILAICCILESPTNTITPIITQSIDILLDNIQNTKEASVKDTAAWAIGKICKLHPEPIIPFSEKILSYMINSLTSEPPRVAANACWTIHNLVTITQSNVANNINIFTKIMEALIKASDRHDGNDFNLRNSAYEAINVVILNAPNAALPLFEQLLQLFLKRLEDTINQNANQQLVEHQESLCGVLQIISTRCPDLIAAYSDKIMSVLYFILKSATGSQVSQEIFLTISMIVNIIEASFVKYMPSLAEYVISALKNWQDHMACSTAVGCVGDIARAIEKAILPYCDDIVRCLLDNIQNRGLDRSVKPTILTTFGDIAISIKGEFHRYHKFVLEVLDQASQTVCESKVDLENQDLLEYLNKFCNGIFEAYVGIIHGYNDSGNQHAITEFYVPILNLIEFIATQKFSDDQLKKTTLGILGDLIDHVPNVKKMCSTNDQIISFVRTCNTSKDEEVRNWSSWVQEKLK
jgi:importin subunit beta-1